jgi:hypothetical protein
VRSTNYELDRLIFFSFSHTHTRIVQVRVFCSAGTTNETHSSDSSLTLAGLPWSHVDWLECCTHRAMSTVHLT